MKAVFAVAEELRAALKDKLAGREDLPADPFRIAFKEELRAQLEESPAPASA